MYSLHCKQKIPKNYIEALATITNCNSIFQAIMNKSSLASTIITHLNVFIAIAIIKLYQTTFSVFSSYTYVMRRIHIAHIVKYQINDV